jgi:hypothetical protein
MLDVKSSATFKKFCLSERRTQRTFYQKCGADDDILKIVGLNNRTFGTFIEEYVRENFGLEHRTCAENDANLSWLGKIEIKGARRGATGSYFFQHIQKDYDYDFIVTALLEPSGDVVCHIMKKEDILPHLKSQGKNANQGYILYSNAVNTYGRRIYDIKAVEQFVTQV